MTNILAAIVVTLSTNVVTTDNAVYEQIPNPCDCPHRAKLGLATIVIPAVHCEHGSKNGALITPATEKTETTTIMEKRSLKFSFEGKDFEQPLSERKLFGEWRRLKLESKWRQVQWSNGALGFGEVELGAINLPGTDVVTGTNLTLTPYEK